VINAAIYFPNEILFTQSARDLITVIGRRDCRLRGCLLRITSTSWRGPAGLGVNCENGHQRAWKLRRWTHRNTAANGQV